MFRNACKVIRPFTLPVILCRKTVAGQTSGNLGAFVVINDEGWVVTAGHVVQQLSAMLDDVKFVRDYFRQLSAIKVDASIDERERKKRINKLPKPSNGQTDQFAQVWSAFPGRPNLTSGIAYMPVDVAVGRLIPFDPTWVSTYPVFKDPTKDFEPGAMLCRTGFPFHNVVPIWDNANNRFDLPPATFPAPLFPIEGIFTRTVTLNPARIFDDKGTIWGIQCQTVSYDLGFKTTTPQYLNVGVGVHPETLFAIFTAHGIKFQVSAY